MFTLHVLKVGRAKRNFRIALSYVLYAFSPTHVGSPPPGGEPTWFNGCWVCATGLSEPLPHYSLFLASYRPHLSHFLENVIFAIPT